jgi:ubiquinone/menaquinone biosynthesis C-methylase UbiE
MSPIPEWRKAQKGEKGLWDGVAHLDYYILRVLADNSVHVPVVRERMIHPPKSCLEVGIGPFALGISAFLPEIPNRFGLDPLPIVSMSSTPERRIESTEEIRSYIRAIRAPIRYIQSLGEDMPIRSESMDLVICCNVLDHSSDPDAILREIHRILKPSGQLYFGVDTFSLAGLLKWHAWTKHARKDEILVFTHPWRMREENVGRMLRSAGFRVQKLKGHTFMSNLAGHARDSVFWATK